MNYYNSIYVSCIDFMAAIKKQKFNSAFGIKKLHIKEIKSQFEGLAIFDKCLIFIK
jgi:hypothetical protein